MVSVVHIVKGEAASPVLDTRPVRRISAYLVEGDLDTSPQALSANTGRAFQGSVVLGMGFTFDDEASKKGIANTVKDMKDLIEADENNGAVIFPYIGGEEVNNTPTQTYRRWVINFGQRVEAEVRQQWPELLRIVEEKIKPSRLKQASIVNPERWWMHARPGTRLYTAVKPLSRTLAVAQTSPHVSFSFLDSKSVFAHTLIVIAYDSNSAFCVMQSRIHESWTRTFAASMKDDQRYIPSDCFNTFPFPERFQSQATLETAGEAYDGFRAKLMTDRDEGLP